MSERIAGPEALWLLSMGLLLSLSHLGAATRWRLAPAAGLACADCGRAGKA